MSPPIARPFPRFVADAPQEKQPYGAWEERLGEAFDTACAELAADAGAPLDRLSLRYFPERTWAGRTYVPVVGRGDADDELPEYFGHVSFIRDERGEPVEIRAQADFTDDVADENPDWSIDLNDDVIGAWRADRGRGGDVTLIWGSPLIRGPIAATAELGGQVLDQAAVNGGRFTLIAVDAVHGFEDTDLYLEVKLWDRRLRELASESLYEPAEGEEEPAEGEEEPAEGEEEPAEGEPGEEPAAGEEEAPPADDRS